MHRLFWSRTSVAVRLAFVLFGFPILIFTFIAHSFFSFFLFIQFRFICQADFLALLSFCFSSYFVPSIFSSISHFFAFSSRWQFFLSCICASNRAIIMQYNRVHPAIFLGYVYLFLFLPPSMDSDADDFWCMRLSFSLSLSVQTCVHTQKWRFDHSTIGLKEMSMCLLQSLVLAFYLALVLN